MAMIDIAVRENILELLYKIEQEHGVRILHACESGSRAWGFASPDSDYDIRFLYCHAPELYRGVQQPRDVINLPLIGDLDAGGWDIRKAAGLLGKSNGPLIEWLHSPVIYKTEPRIVKQWRECAQQQFRPRSCRAHYLGLAKGMWHSSLQQEFVRAKDYLYALRASLCAEWIRERETIPPVLFSHVFEVAPDHIKKEIASLLEIKSRSNEKDTMVPIADLHDYLASVLMQPHDMEDDPPLDLTPLNQLYASSIASYHEPSAFSSIASIRKSGMLLLDSIAGSHAYGTAHAGSDMDERGIFYLPSHWLAKTPENGQVNDETNDKVFYELGRWVELLSKNNPTAMELLAIPQDCIRYRHPVLDLFPTELFLSKLCRDTFARYAIAQVQKARGLNKKIFHPEPEQRRALSEFCYVLQGQGSIPLEKWLEEEQLCAEQCGLVAVSHAPHTYAIFADREGSHGLRGIFSPKEQGELLYSSVPIHSQPIAWMTCNRDAWKAHVKNHRAYWEWVENRNPQRYAINSSHQRGYDSKNLMHTIRLLEMAKEIASRGEIIVRRPDNKHLLRILHGEFSYEEILAMAEEKCAEIDHAFAVSSLPDFPDQEEIQHRLAEARSVLG